MILNTIFQKSYTKIDNLFWWSTRILNQSETSHPSWDSGRIHCTACGVWKRIYHIHIWVHLNLSMNYLRLESKVYQLYTWNILFSLSSLMFPRPYRATAVEPCNAIHRNTYQDKMRCMTILLFSYLPSHFSVWISLTVVNYKPSW